MRTYPEVQSNDWEKYTTDDGRDYFYNSITQETPWERPADFKCVWLLFFFFFFFLWVEFCLTAPT